MCACVHERMCVQVFVRVRMRACVGREVFLCMCECACALVVYVCVLLRAFLLTCVVVQCILCACCSTSCPSYWWNPDKYLGPAGTRAGRQCARDALVMAPDAGAGGSADAGVPVDLRLA